jgi:hypothetical protein
VLYLCVTDESKGGVGLIRLAGRDPNDNRIDTD